MNSKPTMMLQSSFQPGHRFGCFVEQDYILRLAPVPEPEQVVPDAPAVAPVVVQSVAPNNKSGIEVWMPMRLPPPKVEVYRIRGAILGILYSKYNGINWLTMDRTPELAAENILPIFPPNNAEWSPIPAAEDKSAWKPFSEVPTDEKVYEVQDRSGRIFYSKFSQEWKIFDKSIQGAEPMKCRSDRIYAGLCTGWREIQEGQA